MGDEAFAPLADGVAVAVQFGGDVLVGRVVRLGGAQDDAAAEGQGLGRGAGADEGFELAAQVGIQFDDRGEYFAQRKADFEKRLTEAQQRWRAAMAPYKGPRS